MGYFFRAMEKETGVTLQPAEAENTMVATADMVSSRCAVAAVAETGAVAETAPLTTFSLPVNPKCLYALSAPGMSPERQVAMETCRTLRTRVLELMSMRRAQTLLVTSAVAGEGKTLTAMNLAFAASFVENLTVLLVDADLRKPSVASLLGLQTNLGLDRYLRGNHVFAPLAWDRNPRLAVVPCSAPTEQSTELLHRRDLAGFLDQAKRDYQLVIIDAPPLYPIADSEVLLQQVDAALFCVRAGRTPIELAVETANLAKSKLLGSVLIGDSSSRNKYYHYPDGSGQPVDSPVDHRRDPRHPMEIPVTVEFEDKVVQQFRTVNLSEGGIALRADRQLTGGTSVGVSLTLPGTTTLIQAQGEIVWSSQDGDCGIRVQSPAYRTAVSSAIMKLQP